MSRAKHAALMVPILLALLLVGDGCAGARSQRGLHAATDTIGAAANAAHDAMAEYMRVRAVEALGEESTVEAKFEWIQAQPEWKRTRDLHRRVFMAYDVWVKSNAAAASGDSVKVLDFGLVIDSAKDLFALVGEYVPAVSRWIVVGERVIVE